MVTPNYTDFNTVCIRPIKCGHCYKLQSITEHIIGESKWPKKNQKHSSQIWNAKRMNPTGVWSWETNNILQNEM